jgi:prepilin-type N-terminal cleavage/methylation domain-containing protein
MRIFKRAVRIQDSGFSKHPLLNSKFRTLNSVHGFSLVELAIVLMIVGLLIGAVLVGSSLYEVAARQALAEDIHTINTAVKNFREKYRAIPGDMPNASTVLGNLSDGTTAATNGNGNGALATGAPDETLVFWQHLGLAGLIPGEFTGTGTLAINVNAMKSGYNSYAGYHIVVVAPDVFITLSRFNAGGAGVALLEPSEARAVDEAYDDGLPNSGSIRGLDGSSPSGSCLSGAAYDTANTGEACILRFLVSALQEGTTTAQNPADATAVISTCANGQTVGGATTTTPCPELFTGNVTLACRYGGILEPTTVTSCTPLTLAAPTACAETTDATTYWPNVPADTVGVVGTCRPGFFSANGPTRDCSALGGWGLVTGACS